MGKIERINALTQLEIINLYKISPSFFDDSVLKELKLINPNAYGFVMNKKSELENADSIKTESKDVNFNLMVARKYITKCNNATNKGIDFTLTLPDVARIMKTKKCYYSGIDLSKDTITIDRIDNSKGYIKGNVVACHDEVNAFKGTIENPATFINKDMALKVLKKWHSS